MRRLRGSIDCSDSPFYNNANLSGIKPRRDEMIIENISVNPFLTPKERYINFLNSEIKIRYAFLQ